MSLEVIQAELDRVQEKVKELRLKLRIEQMNEDARRYVRVQFPGNTKSYCYELAPGCRAEIGTYVSVWSPWTGNDELVRIRYHGRGDWKGTTKIAYPIRWRKVEPGEVA